MNQDFPDGSSIGDLTDHEKVALHALLAKMGLETLSQTVISQVKYADVPTNQLFDIYDFRLKNFPNSRIKSDLESLVGNMSKFEGNLIRFVITRNDAFKYLIFTDKNFNQLLGKIESSPLK